MNKTLLIKGIVVSALASFMATKAIAADYAKYKVRVGITNVDPKSSNGVIGEGVLSAGIPVDVKDDTALTFNGVYMINENVGIELLAATPFDHDIAVAGGPVIGNTKHLPPTLSAQYYFTNDSKFTPYVGLGLNYTLFFNDTLNATGIAAIEADTGPDTVQDLILDASFGLAYQIGVDYDIDEKWLVNLDLRKIDIDTDVEVAVDGLGKVDVGEVNIDPTVISLNVGYKF